MVPVYVFEDSQVERLYPLTYSRGAFELRVGTCTLLERMERNLRGVASGEIQGISGVLVRSGSGSVGAVMRGRVGGIAVNPMVSGKEGVVLLNGRWLMMAGEAKKALEEVLLAPDRAGLKQSTIVWMHLSRELAAEVDWSRLHEVRTLEALLPKVQRVTSGAVMIERPWDLLAHQRAGMVEDFAVMGKANEGTVMAGAHVLGAENVHLAKGVKVWPGVVLDATGGPILVGEGTEIRANAVVTGPVAIGEHCVVRTGADIREETTLGPGCKVGGEVIGSVFQGHGNKQHHGFVGQSVIGEWVNLGAGTTTSNLKNTYGLVKVPLNGVEEATGRQFMGSVIADHAKLGIGTYLSTGSVVGFGSHVVVDRPPRFVPSFAWLTEKGMMRAEFEKIEQVAAMVMKRRGVEFTGADHELFVRIASESSAAEKYEWPSK